MDSSIKQVPGPKGKWLLGHIAQIKNQGILRFYEEQWQRYGDVFQVQVGPQNLVVFVHPEHVNQILVEKKENYFKGKSYKALRWFLGQGLATSEGELWARQRKLMRESFTMQSLKDHVPTMTHAIEGLAETWEQQTQLNTQIDIGSHMRQLTVRIISETLFGNTWDANDLSNLQIMEDFLHQVGNRMNRPFAPPLAIPTPENLRFRRLQERFIQQLKNFMQTSLKNEQNLNCLLHRLQNHQTLHGQINSTQQILDEFTTLFFAGYETTASSLGWTWMLLHQYPEVAKKLRSELDETLCGLNPRFDDLDKLKYTTAVLMESLRLYPPAWAVARDVRKDDVIGGYFIPKGSIVVMPVYLTHRHPAFWSDPNSFSPDRFMLGGFRKTLKDGYFPFSHGQRNCLGNLFSLMEMKLAIAILAQRFELILDSEQPVAQKAVVILEPENPLMMRIHQRHRRNQHQATDEAVTAKPFALAH